MLTPFISGPMSLVTFEITKFKLPLTELIFILRKEHLAAA
jgi:hypothetical protein